MKVLLVAPYYDEQHRWMASAQKAAEQLSKDHDVAVLTTSKPAFAFLGTDAYFAELFIKLCYPSS